MSGHNHIVRTVVANPNSGFVDSNGMPSQCFSYHTIPGMTPGVASRPNNVVPPPPVPPRPQSLGVGSPNVYSTGPFSHMPYNRYSVAGYPPYGAYRGLGYGPRYGGYGPQNYWGSGVGIDGPEDDFIRMAEEQSRPAFQSIESLVNAVGSITMMLESTYHAFYNSYRAVLGVVENFSHLRNHLTHILSTLALIRTLRWLCLKILYLLGIRKTNPSADSAWSSAVNVAINGERPSQAQEHSSWPLFTFLGLVFGAPWLIYRIFSKATRHVPGHTNWSYGALNEDRYGVALFDFHSRSPSELSFKAGQKIILAPKNLQPKEKTWLLAAVNGKKGLIPANYVHTIGKKVPLCKKTAEIMQNGPPVNPSTSYSKGMQGAPPVNPSTSCSKGMQGASSVNPNMSYSNKNPIVSDKASTSEGNCTIDICDPKPSTSQATNTPQNQ